MQSGVGKGLLLGHFTQKPGNVIGTERGESGQQNWFFLRFGSWVLGRGQHGENPSWSAGFLDVRAGKQKAGRNGLEVGSDRERGRGRGKGRKAAPTQGPPASPSPQLPPARPAAAPPPDLGTASPSPPPPPPTRRCSCCRRTILHVANGGDAQGRPQVRARGSWRRAGGGAAAGTRARAAPAPSARAGLRSKRLLCVPRLGMLWGGVPTAPSPPMHSVCLPANPTSTQPLFHHAPQ